MPKIVGSVREALAVKAPGVISVDSSASVRQCAGAMVEREVGALVVLDRERLVGIVTWHDVLAAVAKGIDKDSKAGDIMNAPVETTTEDAELEDVEARMVRRHIRHMPVVRGSQVVGMLSRIDVLRRYLSMQQSLAEDLHSYILGAYPR